MASLISGVYPSFFLMFLIIFFLSVATNVRVIKEEFPGFCVVLPFICCYHGDSISDVLCITMYCHGNLSYSELAESTLSNRKQFLNSWFVNSGLVFTLRVSKTEPWCVPELLLKQELSPVQRWQNIITIWSPVSPAKPTELIGSTNEEDVQTFSWRLKGTGQSRIYCSPPLTWSSSVSSSPLPRGRTERRRRYHGVALQHCCLSLKRYDPIRKDHQQVNQRWLH